MPITFSQPPLSHCLTHLPHSKTNCFTSQAINDYLRNVTILRVNYHTVRNVPYKVLYMTRTNPDGNMNWLLNFRFKTHVSLSPESISRPFIHRTNVLFVRSNASSCLANPLSSCALIAIKISSANAMASSRLFVN